MKEGSYLTSVKDQYENYPYPPRDPEKEKTQLTHTTNDALDQINYYCFEGKETFQDHFKVLIAGGGTGDATVFMAEQLRKTNAEIVHLDLSTKSIALAKKRIQNRKLTNVTFLEESLLNVPELDIGPFDYINCSGVLHHLPDPVAGLNALKAKLKPGGAMGIMVYGTYGRTGIYYMQETLRRMADEGDDIQTRIEDAKKIINHQLPAGNHFRGYQHQEADHMKFGDVGIYDLLLHSQDRPYTVPELYEWVEGLCGLHLQHFIKQYRDGQLYYIPEPFIRDAELRAKVAAKPRPEREAIAELLLGDIDLHCFYITDQERALPDIDDRSMVPFFTLKFLADTKNYEVLLKSAFHGREPQVVVQFKGFQLGFDRKPYSGEIFKQLDGRRSLQDMYDNVRNELGGDISEDELHAHFKNIFNTFQPLDILLLREPHVKPQPLPGQMQRRVIQMYPDVMKKLEKEQKSNA